MNPKKYQTLGFSARLWLQNRTNNWRTDDLKREKLLELFEPFYNKSGLLLEQLYDKFNVTPITSSQSTRVEEKRGYGINIQEFERVHGNIPKIFFVPQQRSTLKSESLTYADYVSKVPFSPRAKQKAAAFAVSIQGVSGEGEPGEELRQMAIDLYQTIDSEWAGIKARILQEM